MYHIKVNLNLTAIPSFSLHRKALQSKVYAGFVKIVRWEEMKGLKVKNSTDYGYA